jgi:8-amino-3,8-dideoxy-alpha-D-manno-octulosonate transaminase
VIEDVAQACGGEYGGQWLGTFGNAGCFSFGQYKILSSGEGGMVVTNDEMLATRVRSYHDTAACWRPQRYAVERMPGELFAGQNYRMSELHGAIASAQLVKLPKYLSRNRAFRSELMACLEPSAIAPLTVAPDNDARGDAGENVVLLAPSRQAAVDVQERLAESAKRISYHLGARRDWHVYQYWQHILNGSAVNRVGYPFSSYPMETLNYSVDACPKTLDVLDRAIFVHIPSLVGRMSPAAVWQTFAEAIHAS